MKDDMFFLAIAAMAIAAQIAVSSPRGGGQPGAPAAMTAGRPAHARAESAIHQIESVTVVGRRSDGESPADQIARVDEDNH